MTSFLSSLLQYHNTKWMVGLTYQTLGRASASAYFCPVMFLCFLANGNEYTHKTYRPLSVRFVVNLSACPVWWQTGDRCIKLSYTLYTWPCFHISSVQLTAHHFHRRGLAIIHRYQTTDLSFACACDSSSVWPTHGACVKRCIIIIIITSRRLCI